MNELREIRELARGKDKKNVQEPPKVIETEPTKAARLATMKELRAQAAVGTIRAAS